MRGKGSTGLYVLLVILIGAILGNLIGMILGDTLPILNYGKSIGVNPFVVDLSFLELTFGLNLYLNLSGIIGITLALIIFKKL